MLRKLSNIKSEWKARRAAKKAQKIKIPFRTKWNNLINDFSNDTRSFAQNNAKSFIRWFALYVLLAFLSVVMTETGAELKMNQFPQD